MADLACPPRSTRIAPPRPSEGRIALGARAARRLAAASAVPGPLARRAIAPVSTLRWTVSVPATYVRSCSTARAIGAWKTATANKTARRNKQVRADIAMPPSRPNRRQLAGETVMR